MKKLFLIILSVFIFSANIFSQVVYSEGDRGVQINLEDKSTEILLFYDDDNNLCTIEIENADNGFHLLANIKSDEGKLLSAKLEDEKSNFEFITNIDSNNDDDDYYHSYSFRIGDFKDIANICVTNKNRENLDATIFRGTSINSTDVTINGYVSDNELNKSLENIRANLKGTSTLDEFEKEQLAWENYKSAHLKMLFHENLDDEKNLPVEAKNEIKRMNAMRMSELLLYPTSEYKKKMELSCYYNDYASYNVFHYTATVLDTKMIVKFDFLFDGIEEKTFELPNPLLTEKIYDTFIIGEYIYPEIKTADYERELRLEIGKSFYRIVSEDDDFTKTSPNFKDADLIIELHKYIMEKIKEQQG